MSYHSYSVHAYNAAQAQDEALYESTTAKMLILNNQFTLGLLTREDYIREMTLLVLTAETN